MVVSRGSVTLCSFIGQFLISKDKKKHREAVQNKPMPPETVFRVKQLNSETRGINITYS